MRHASQNSSRAWQAGTMAAIFITAMLMPPVSYAQVAFLPPVGKMVGLTPAFNPMLVRGMAIHKDNPFKMDFIIDQGDEHLSQAQMKAEGKKLVSYFLASLTTPEKEIWVNLSPYEKSRIIQPAFGQTQMGKELLAQDYVLKQTMASALYPEHSMGHEFWKKVYAEVAQKFGTTNLPVDTFNKVWIVPDKAVVYENSKTNAVFVVDSSLKVMLEQDYLAANKDKAKEQYGLNNLQGRNAVLRRIAARIVKEVVIPALEKEVNTGKNFAPLRQVYQCLILAKWYKENLKKSVLTQGYADRNKIMGINVKDKNISQEIYAQYLQAYRKGVYNFIKEEQDPATNQLIPRKYFSGGFAVPGDFALISVKNPAYLANTLMRRIFGLPADKNKAPNGSMGRKTFLVAVGVVAAGHMLPVTSAAMQFSSNSLTLTQSGQTQSNNLLEQSAEKEIVRSVVQGVSGYTVPVNYVAPVIQIINYVLPRENQTWFIDAVLRSIIAGLASALSSGAASPGPGENPPLELSSVYFTPGLATLLTAMKFDQARIVPLSAAALAGIANPANFILQDEKDKHLGGIDLEKTQLQTKTDGTGVTTAFGDPQQLKALLNADGLNPIILNVKPLTTPTMNKLLGISA